MQGLGGTDRHTGKDVERVMAISPQALAWPAIIYGTAWKKDATAELTDQAIAAGFRAIDTANQPLHYHEPGVGEGVAAAMKRRGIRRDELFLQTKFSPLGAQGAEVPYTRDAAIGRQVEESLRSSLAHLGTDYLDCLLLHGPQHTRYMSDADWEAWRALEAAYQRGDVRSIGISNIGTGHLEDLLDNAWLPPMAVQNRCFARNGWDRDVRALCAEHGIVHQAFSLLTANPFAVEHPEIRRVADEHDVTPAQIIFAFARHVGMIPLTGTTSPRHMAEDLAGIEIALGDRDARLVEHIAGS